MERNDGERSRDKKKGKKRHKRQGEGGDRGEERKKKIVSNILGISISFATCNVRQKCLKLNHTYSFYICGSKHLLSSVD